MEICLQESHKSKISAEGLAAGGYLQDLPSILWQALGDLIWGRQEGDIWAREARARKGLGSSCHHD